MSPTPAVDRGRRPSTLSFLAAGVFLGLVVVALAVRPIVGVALAALGAIFIVFRQIDLDATAVLTVYLLLLTLLPASYVVPALGAAGTPAGIVALAVGYWWVLERTVPRPGGQVAPEVTGFQPLRAALAFYFVTAAMAFVVSFSRPLTTIEANGTARAMIGVAGSVGLALLASDGIRSRDRLNVLVNRALNFCSIMAVIACVQYFTDFDPVAGWNIPGLKLNQDLASVTERSVVTRVASTTLHPIEFGAVVAIMLPLALHTALYAEPRVRARRWARVGLLGLALPLSVSRTAVVIAVVVIVMMWPAWTWARRLRFAAAAAVFLLAVRAAVSGLLGTILALFTSFNQDPSTTGRTDDYGLVLEFFSERPLFGRGIGTLDPGLYFFLDNQLLGTLVTGGLFGLAGLLVLIGTAATLARQVYWHGPNEESRHFGAALAAAIVGGAFGFLTFDALGFPVFAGLMFLLMGMAGAAWRLELAGAGRAYTNPRVGRSALSAAWAGGRRPDVVDDR